VAPRLSILDGGLFCFGTTVINQASIYQQLSLVSGKIKSRPAELAAIDFDRTKNFLAFLSNSM